MSFGFLFLLHRQYRIIFINLIQHECYLKKQLTLNRIIIYYSLTLLKRVINYILPYLNRLFLVVVIMVGIEK